MNRKHAQSLPVVLALLLAGPVAAQEAGTTPEQQAAMAAFQKAGAPGAEHANLAATAGTYDLDIRSWHGPGTEPVADTGTATRRMILGNRVMVEDVDARMMGQPFTGHGLHGFDNITGKYWATWNDSMTTSLMVSQGSCDADGACTYLGSFNDPVSGKAQATRMTTRWTDPSTEVFEMYAPGPDGKEFRMMQITYRKRAP